MNCSIDRHRCSAHEKITPVYMGTAYRNKGVQLLLDSIARYLPSPLERETLA